MFPAQSDAAKSNPSRNKELVSEKVSPCKTAKSDQSVTAISAKDSSPRMAIARVSFTFIVTNLGLDF